MKKESVVDIRNTDEDEYTAKRNRRTDRIIRILSVIGAILIWVYAVTADTTTYDYQNVSVSVKSESLVKSKGYNVEHENLKVNFTVQGSVAKISQLTNTSVEVYADLSTVDLSTVAPGQSITVPLPLVYRLPTGISNLSITYKSQDYINVVISKLAK